VTVGELDSARPAGADTVALAEIRWAAIGDSFTAGVSPGERTWFTEVGARLAAERPVQLLNLARVGARTDAVEREQLPAALETDPNLLTLICGGNDVIGNVRPPLDEIAAGLERVFESARAALPDAALLTATYPAIGTGALRPRTRRRIAAGLDALNTSIRALAERHRITCVELADHPGRGERANYAADGIHPSASGHRAAAEVLGAAIESAIRGTATATATDKEHR
jgi:lysophospholipase L1-like esterase